MAIETPPKLRVAVPDYLSDALSNYETLPPGHIYNLYAPMWVSKPFVRKEEIWQLGEDIQEKKENKNRGTDGIEKRLGGKSNALEETSKPKPKIKENIDAIVERQQHFYSKIKNSAIFPLKITAPMAIGLGNEHPVENGFAFLTPYGLPYVAGSAVKGVLRAAAVEMLDSEKLSKEDIQLLFGQEESKKEGVKGLKGALSFWDAFPQIKHMVVEIMTPHFKSYYDGNSSPHDQGQPTPVSFLAVPAGTNMNLIVQCDETKLSDSYDWKQKIEFILQHAGKWGGFGAKTAVGYGAFEVDTTALTKLLEEEKQETLKEAQEKEMLQMSPEEKANFELKTKLQNLISEFEQIKADEKTYNPSSSKLGPKLNDIYTLCEKLKTEECKTLLENILSFVKNNKNRKKAVQAKINEIFAS